MADLGEMFGGGATATFLGLPAGDPAAPAGDIVIFGADCATPYASVGAYCAGGPAAIRAGGAAYSGDLSKVNFDLGGPLLPAGVRAVDAGDLAVDPADAGGNRAAIAETARRILAVDAVPVLLGGDDSLPIPLLEALGEGEGPLTVLQIDAHIDWRDEVEGERRGLSSTMRRASEMAHVERIIQVGARGIGSAGMTELQAARDWGVHLIPAHEFSDAQAVAGLIPEGARVAICFDCDALDPSIMPAVIAPTAGGLSYGQVLGLIRAVAARARIASFDMVEFMPTGDRDGEGARTAAQLLASVLGLIGEQCGRAG